MNSTSNTHRKASGWLSPLQAIFLLALGTIIYRAISSQWHVLPNFSPMVGLALVASVYLPRAWGWTVAAIIFFATEFLFLGWNKFSTGSIFSFFMLLGPVFYSVYGLLFALICGKQRSLWLFLGASVVASISFYIISNTASWSGSPEYSQTWLGWVQANTTGEPGYPPTWVFLRNALVGDLFFTMVCLAVIDPALVKCPLASISKGFAVASPQHDLSSGTK